MIHRFLILGILVSSLLVACSKEDLPVATPITENAALSHYLERFENEAAKRGLDFDLAARGLTYSIEEIEERNVAGYCAYQNHVATDIVIDATFFDESNDNWKEMVIFHELGHCVLYRDHNESKLVNGNCGSIMRSGVEDCRDAYSPTTRTYYLNELFSEINTGLVSK